MIQVLSHAAVFVCPSIYEPLGIVNLEAMACEAAVVATRDRRDPRGRRRTASPGCSCPSTRADDPSREPRDPARFATDIADRVNTLLHDPALARAMGEAGRRRAVEEFGWAAVADRVAGLYRALTA